MANEKVVQISAASKDEIFGLSENGSLVKWDTQIAHWVVRGSSEIKTAQGASLMKPDLPTVNPQGRYRNPEPVKTKKESKFVIDPLFVAIGIMGLAFLIYVFIR